ncbi:MAG: SH3 domain-containing protein [Hyphomicrobiales bacterium]
MANPCYLRRVALAPLLLGLRIALASPAVAETGGKTGEADMPTALDRLIDREAPGTAAQEAEKALAPTTSQPVGEGMAAEPTAGAERPAGAAIRLAEVEPRQCARRAGAATRSPGCSMRGGLPVEVIQEFENWRRVRDLEGAEGWVFHSLVSGRRTALVAPWEKGLPLTLHKTAVVTSDIAALLEPGVLADVAECTGDWCLLTGDAFSGWIEQNKLWGVYPGERFD